MATPRARPGARERGGLLDDLDQGDDLVARDPVGELRMIAAEMRKRELDELIVGVAADDLAAFARDLPGHGWYRGDCRVAPFRVCWPKRWSERPKPTCSSAGALSWSSAAAASSSASPAGRAACSSRHSCSNGRARLAAPSGSRRSGAASCRPTTRQRSPCSYPSCAPPSGRTSW